MNDLVDPVDDLGRLWEFFADTSCCGYSPLYDRISRAVARDRTLLDMVREGPPAAHLPMALLGAVHYLVLGGAGDLLAEVYAGLRRDPSGRDCLHWWSIGPLGSQR